MFDGTTTERRGALGTFSWDGKGLMRTDIVGDARVAIYISKKDNLSDWDDFTVFLNGNVYSLAGIWEIRYEGILVGVGIEDDDVISGLSLEGKELGPVRLFSQKIIPHDIWGSVRVFPEGYIYQMVSDERAVVIRRYEILE